ncbi:hypothetical protein [Aeromicrobium sp. UC242_57]|uniref:hypothetical protein n=1 Tax=Aeromicrobium sp. UC242_57 TaxID=3374624 RepID=UPI0037BA323C
MTGRLSLRGYQIGGRSNSIMPPFWTMFQVDRIAELVITTAVFPADPPGYPSGDQHIHPVIAGL